MPAAYEVLRPTRAAAATTSESRQAELSAVDIPAVQIVCPRASLGCRRIPSPIPSDSLPKPRVIHSTAPVALYYLRIPERRQHSFGWKPNFVNSGLLSGREPVSPSSPTTTTTTPRRLLLHPFFQVSTVTCGRACSCNPAPHPPIHASHNGRPRGRACSWIGSDTFHAVSGSATPNLDALRLHATSLPSLLIHSPLRMPLLGCRTSTCCFYESQIRTLLRSADRHDLPPLFPSPTYILEFSRLDSLDGRRPAYPPWRQMT